MSIDDETGDADQRRPFSSRPLEDGVTAALIVRDEEKFLPACLTSLAGVVDNVVVVDTGSTDSTRAIAASFGAKLADFTWTGDFAAARNTALALVQTTWILYIDADEAVSTPDHRPILSWLDPNLHAGGTVRFRPRPGYTFYQEPRLFRNDPSIRFKGRIHETQVPDLLAFAERHALALARTPIILNHYGYEGDQAHKAVRNIPLLQAAVIDDPGRAYCWHHLAEMLAVAGRRDEAKATCRSGIAIPRVDHSKKGGVDRREIFKTLARLLVEDGDETGDLTDHLVNEAPDDWSIAYLHARALLKRGDFVSVARIGRHLLEVNPDALDDGLTAFDTRLFSEFAWELIALAHYKMGRSEEAANAFTEAARLAPSNVAYRAKAIALGPKPIKLGR